MHWVRGESTGIGVSCYGQEQAGVLRALRIEATKQLIFKEPGMDLYVCPRQLVLRPGRLGRRCGRLACLNRCSARW
jgi:hypothetical protein